MRCARLWLVGLGVLAAAAASLPARAGDPPRKPALSAEKLAERIDELIDAKLKAQEITPAEPADDAEFLRRLSLDVGGRIPAVQDVRLFLADKAADKRHKAVDRLLDSPLYSTHFAAVWRSLMVPDSNNPFLQQSGPQLEAWLKNRLRENTTYDKMVREIITTPVVFNRAAMQRNQQGEPTPLPFYQAQEMKPENLAGATARLFLGVKIECAQCHNHPFDTWKREQFWEYAAFFGQDGKEITISGTTKKVSARFPDGSLPKGAGRAALAEWMTSGENRYFARNAVNRLWEYFYGNGLIDPVDEPRADNPPSHPELLERLTKEFVAHKFDLNFMVRTLTATRAYALASKQSDPSQADPRLFARMAVRGLTAEQLYDSILEVVGPDGLPNAAPPQGGFAPGVFNRRGEFLTRFPPQEKRTEVQTSILQALYLMNGKFMEEVTDPQRNRTLGTIIESRGTTGRRLDELYMVTLARKPTTEERARLVKYVEEGGPSHDSKKAYADVFWALLNSSEFFLNH